MILHLSKNFDSSCADLGNFYSVFTPIIAALLWFPGLLRPAVLDVLSKMRNLACFFHFFNFHFSRISAKQHLSFFSVSNVHQITGVLLRRAAVTMPTAESLRYWKLTWNPCFACRLCKEGVSAGRGSFVSHYSRLFISLVGLVSIVNTPKHKRAPNANWITFFINCSLKYMGGFAVGGGNKKTEEQPSFVYSLLLFYAALLYYHSQRQFCWNQTTKKYKRNRHGLQQLTPHCKISLHANILLKISEEPGQSAKCILERSETTRSLLRVLLRFGNLFFRCKCFDLQHKDCKQHVWLWLCSSHLYYLRVALVNDIPPHWFGCILWPTSVGKFGSICSAIKWALIIFECWTECLHQGRAPTLLYVPLPGLGPTNQILFAQL